MIGAIPCLVTLLGHVLTVEWLLGGPWLLGLAGLLCDVADGWIARLLGQSTAVGAEYDWLVDTTTVALLLATHPPFLVPMVFLQAVARTNGVRVSGRAALTLVVIGCDLWSRGGS